MYIPEFWCGVIVCIVVEFCALIVYSIYLNVKGKANKDGKDNINKSHK